MTIFLIIRNKFFYNCFNMYFQDINSRYVCLLINNLHNELFKGYQIFAKIEFLCSYSFLKNDYAFF